MSTAKHSPLPWRRFDADSLEVVSADSHTVCDVYQCGGIREIDEADDNADLIIRAVNSYESSQQLIKQLTEALEATKSTLKGLRELSESQAAVQYKDYADYAVRQIDTALAAVKQQEQK